MRDALAIYPRIVYFYMHSDRTSDTSDFRGFPNQSDIRVCNSIIYSDLF